MPKPSTPAVSPHETSPTRPVLLHVGCGRSPLDGWINVDLQVLPGVDVVVDVTRGLPFARATAIFAEHFLEHLEVHQALDFLAASHRVLVGGGWIRLSTPNLAWVLETHFHPDLEDTGTVHLNRAFYGWEHRFLWDRSFLTRALEACGFADLRWPAYGESELEHFRGVERHPRSEDAPGLMHVLLVEARKSTPRPDALAALHADLRDQFSGHLEEARLRRARIEMERLQGRLARAEAELGQTLEALEQARRRAGELETTVLAMRASRFWRARDLWWRLRGLVGAGDRTS